MQWELPELLTEVKRVCYQNIRTVERLLLYTSMAQNAAPPVFKNQREQKGYLFTLEELTTLQALRLIRADLAHLSRMDEENRKKGFYLLRRRLIEVIEALLKKGTAQAAPREINHPMAEPVATLSN